LGSDGLGSDGDDEQGSSDCVLNRASVHSI
jgi:hypothetical protein